jgi:hypothetical protein
MFIDSIKYGYYLSFFTHIDTIVNLKSHDFTLPQVDRESFRKSPLYLFPLAGNSLGDVKF